MKVSYSIMGASEHLKIETAQILTNLSDTLAFISASALKTWKDTMLGTAFEIYRVKMLE